MNVGSKGFSQPAEHASKSRMVHRYYLRFLHPNLLDRKIHGFFRMALAIASGS
jgi:hypothetical protein